MKLCSNSEANLLVERGFIVKAIFYIAKNRHDKKLLTSSRIFVFQYRDTSLFYFTQYIRNCYDFCSLES